MKLAQALTERSDLQKRIEQLKNRLNNNALVQEGEKPAEDPNALFMELDTDIARLEGLICKINETNSQKRNGQLTITELLAKRDCMVKKLEILRNFLDRASTTAMRGTRSEIKILSTVNVSDTQKEVDLLAKELRELDIKIQELNWTTELCE